MKRRNSAFLLATAVFFSVSAMSAFDLIKGNHAAEIVLGKNADPSSHLAAKELSDYVGKMTGRKLAIKTETSTAANRIYIGTLTTVKNIPAELVKKLNAMESREACAFLVRGKNMYIIGKNEVAELYGTYHFMEDKLGIRWLKTANKIDPGEYVPAKKEIVIKDYVKYRAPYFFKRALDQCGAFGNVIPVNSKVWANRNGFQTPVPYDRWYPLNPKSKLDKMRYDFYRPRIPLYDQTLGGTHGTFSDPFRHKSSYKKMFAEHPEYFALVNGKRVMGHQICISNPEVQRLVADSIITRLKANKDVGQFTFGMVDTPIGWCECAGCKAYDNNDKRADFNEVSTRFYMAVNAVAKLVYAKYPNADLRTWAYSAYRLIPHNVKVDPRLKLQYTTHGRCWGHQLDDPDCVKNVKIYNHMKEWRKFHPTVMYTYEYFFCSHGYYTCIEDTLDRTLKLYKKHNITGWKEQAYFEDSKFVREEQTRPDLYPSNWQMLYLTGKLLWDPDLDAKKVVDEAESLYYGKTYPVMKKYHAYRRQLWKMATACMGYPAGNPRAVELLNPPDAKETLLKYLDEAEKLAGNDKILKFRIGEDRRWLKKWWIAPYDKLHSAGNKPLSSPEISGKIKIDGIGNEKDWNKACVADNFLEMLGSRKDKPAPEAVKTTARILSDKDNLYFLITAKEPSPEKLTTTVGRDSKVWSRDCVEVFIYPPSVENVYYQLAVGPKGAIFDALQPGTNKAFNLDVEVKTRILKDRYVVEMRVPVNKLMKMTKGDTWKVHIVRDRMIKDQYSASRGDMSFYVLGGVTHRDYTSFRPMLIGAEEPPVYRNGNFNTLQKLNEVQVRLFAKKGRSAVNNMMPFSWQFNQNNAKLEMVLHPGSKDDYYVKQLSGALYQLHYGRKRNYRITFRAKGDGKLKFQCYRYRANDKRKITKSLPTRTFMNGQKLEKDWKKYSFVLRKEFADEIFATAFINVGGVVEFDDVVITPEADLVYHHYDEKKQK